MAANNTITDDELRNQLLELGENVGPVTATTRPLLLRKLKKLQKEGTPRPQSAKKDTRRKSTPATLRGRRRSPSRKLVGFSSDEESEDTGYRTRTRLSGGRTSVKKEEEASRDNVDGGREGLGRLQSSGRERGNSSVQSFNSPIESNITDDLSDSERSAYTGPFQRGTFRFRSIRRRRDSPESTKYKVQKDVYPDEKSFDYNIGQDSPDGGYKYVKKKQSNSSFLLALAIAIVLICIALLLAYLEYLPPRRNWITSTQSDSLPFCENSMVNDSCINAEQVSNIYAMHLYHSLSKKAGRFACGEEESDETKNISSAEFKKKIKKDHPNWTTGFVNKAYRHTLKLLVEKVEDFGIRMYNKNNAHENNTEDIKWLDSDKPSKSLACRIKQSFNKIMTAIVVIICVAAVFIGIYLIVRSRWQKEEEETHMMYRFVENIIDILRKHHDACKTDKDLPPYLPIPHVRDMLIKPADRQAKSIVWNRAVRFLSANESRIRVESQRIAGEDFEVWRWIHITSPKHHSHKMAAPDSKKPKCWQGQAFENFQWAVNPPIISPTPCLKIRNMFDPDVELVESWHVFIQDAILEKCIDAGADIVHIAVDKSSSEGCVYVKCDTQNSAGTAFKSLHGSWFDGRLVAVKYLTLRRYHQRFPKSLTATGSLRPSGTSPSSLVTLDPEDNMDMNDSDTEV